MAQGSFSASVNAWVKESKARMLAVRNESAQRVIEIAQTTVHEGGNLPFKTGFLRASLMAGIGPVNFNLTKNPNANGAYSYDAGQITLAIASANLNDTITAVYTANYARVAEYGSENRPARRFVALAAQQFPKIVEQVAAEAQARVAKK